jgi:hypothetical protein
MRTLQQRMKAAAVALVMSSIATSSGDLIAHAQSTSASPPPTLNGEIFSVASSGISNNKNSVQCNPDGSGTFTYTATGTANGPYFGPFNETGTVTIDSSRNITVTASFTITSPQGM